MLCWRVMRLRNVFLCESYFISVFFRTIFFCCWFALLVALCVHCSKWNVMCTCGRTIFTWGCAFLSSSRFSVRVSFIFSCAWFLALCALHLCQFKNVQILCYSHWHLWLYIQHLCAATPSCVNAFHVSFPFPSIDNKRTTNEKISLAHLYIHTHIHALH